MIWGLLGIGGVYWLLRDNNMPQEEEQLPDEGGIPMPPKQDFVKIAEWSGEYSASGSGGDNVVWFYRTGIRYEDGTTEMDSSTYIVIGDKNHHKFYRASVSGGTINIPKEMSGGEADMKNVVVFPSLEEASAKADELSNPVEEDDPLGPQKQPEEEDEPTQPTLPTRPDFGGGLGGGYTPFGGGF